MDYGVWDTEKDSWIPNAEDGEAPVSYSHPFFAKGMLDMWAGPRWEREGRYEVRQLPEPREDRVSTALYDVMTLLKEEKFHSETVGKLYDIACDICEQNDLDPITAQEE